MPHCASAAYFSSNAGDEGRVSSPTKGKYPFGVLHDGVRCRPHPDGCSSSRFSSSSIPSRMKDDVLPYFVYGATFVILSHVAWSRRKVTTRGFRVIGSPHFREAVAPDTGSAVLFMGGLGAVRGVGGPLWFWVPSGYLVRRCRIP